MASLKTCSNSLVINCGECIGVYDFSHPSDVSILRLPEVPAPQNKQKQKVKNASQDAEEKLAQSSPSSPPTPLPTAPPLPPNRVLAIDVSPDGLYIVVCDDRKYLHVFHDQKLEGQGRWRVASSRMVSRRCTVVRFTSDLQTILVGDKSGDVFSFPTTPSTITTTTTTTTSPSSSASNTPSSTTTAAVGKPLLGEDCEINVETGERCRRGVYVAMETDEAVVGDAGGGGDGVGVGEDGAAEGDGDGGGVGTLVLGHLSMLLDMIVIDRDRYVVTSDRDEKIRISCYPDAYNIHTFCLGHTSFVISLACDDAKKLVFSGAGDVSLGLWSYGGDLIDLRNCLEDFPQLETAEGEIEGDKNTSPQGDTEERQAVQQIVYSPDTNLLFVALYRCPHILIYRLQSQSEQQEGKTFSLQPLKTLPISSTTTTATTTTNTTDQLHRHVVSLAVRGSTLWIAREAGWPHLQLEAVKFSVQEGGGVETNGIEMAGDSEESRALKVFSNHTDTLLNAPPTWQDPFPTLWKSQADGYVQEYMERKRQRVEGEGAGAGERWGNKKHKARRWEKKKNGKKNEGECEQNQSTDAPMVTS